MISCTMIIYLKEKSRGVEIKTEITWDDFKLVTMMFVYEGDFPTLGKKPTIGGMRYFKKTKEECMTGVDT